MRKNSNAFSVARSTEEFSSTASVHGAEMNSRWCLCSVPLKILFLEIWPGIGRLSVITSLILGAGYGFVGTLRSWMCLLLICRIRSCIVRFRLCLVLGVVLCLLFMERIAIGRGSIFGTIFLPVLLLLGGSSELPSLSGRCLEGRHQRYSDVPALF